MNEAFFLSLCFIRTAGSILGAGFNAFISDWDKISATVSATNLFAFRMFSYLGQHLIILENETSC